MGMSGTEQKNHKTALAALDAKLTAAMDTMEEGFAKAIEDLAKALDDRVKAEALDRARSLKHAADSLAIHAHLVDSLIRYRMSMMTLTFWGRLRWLLTGRVYGRGKTPAQQAVEWKVQSDDRMPPVHPSCRCADADAAVRAQLDAQQAAEEDTPVKVECRRVAAELAARAAEADEVMAKFKAGADLGKGDGQC
jgi:hypothetical protein